MLALACSSTTHAQEAAELDEKVTIDVPAQKVSTALLELSKQTNTQIIMPGERLDKLMTAGVHGKMSLRQALSALLIGTPFGFKETGPHTITVAPLRPAETSSSQDLPNSEASAVGVLGTAIDLDQVTVVASRLGQSARDSAQPIIVLTQQEIQRSGAQSVAQALNMVPAVSMQSTGMGTLQGNGSSTTVQLRGLPLGTTLVLLNGRRVETTGAQAGNGNGNGFFDLGAVPIGAVDHIEILPTGSSAIYGGDGLGGVVNIVLKRGFDGLAADVRYGHANGYDDEHVDLSAGHRWSKGSLSVMGSYQSNGALFGSERALTSSDDFTRFGGPDYRSTYGNPANIYSTTKANLPGLSSTFAAVPVGSTGVGLTPADFASTAGTVNKESLQSPLNALYAPQERAGVFIYGTYDLLPAVTLFTEIMYSHGSVDVVGAPLQGQYTVPAANPFNPFGVPVLASYSFVGADGQPILSRGAFTQDTFRPLFGARGKFGAWDWELAGWLSKDWDKLSQENYVNTDAVNASLASTNPNTALNVFAAGPGGSPSLIQSLLQTNRTVYQGGLESASGFIRGPLLELGSGTVEAVLGGEFERDELQYGTTVDASRTNRAAFAEVKLPLIGQRGHGDPMLVVPLAVRYDDYSDFGSHTSFGAGLELRPIRSLLLRASYDSAFKPPALSGLYLPQIYHQNSPITDPQLGGQSYPVTYVSGGNAALQPETGWSTNFGFVFSPEWIPGLDLSVTNWNIRLRNGTTAPTLQYLISNPSLYPGRVERDPSTGLITQVDDTYINYGFINEAGVDYGLSWNKATPLGQFSPSISAAQTYRYRVESAVGAPVAEVVAVSTNTGFAPRWKATAGLVWDYRLVSASIDGHYVNGYRDIQPLNDGLYKHLGNTWYFDGNVRYQIGQQLASQSRWAKDSYVSVGARNLFGRQPVYAHYFSYPYDPNEYDLLGRYVYVQIGVKLQ